MLRTRLRPAAVPAFVVVASLASGFRLVSEQRSEPVVYHFAAEHCKGSEQLLEHLLGRNLSSRMSEVVVYSGVANPLLTRLKMRGYEVRIEAPGEPIGTWAAPWLLVRDKYGKVSYSGGYEPAPYWESRILFHIEHEVRKACVKLPRSVANVQGDS